MNKAEEILLSDESLTCVLCDGKNVLKSSYSGIRPMLEFISKGTDFSEYSAADRIVGRAAAMLFVLAGVKRSVCLRVKQRRRRRIKKTWYIISVW